MRTRLQTGRLVLRPVDDRDEPHVLAHLNDLSVSGWLARVPHPYRAADFHEFRDGIAVPGETFAVEDDAGFAGIISGGAELGYWLAPRAQGRGYATEAAVAVLAEGFAQGRDTVVSGCFEGNLPSARVLAKLGFVETARDMLFCRLMNAMRPHVSLRLTAAAFASRTTSLPWGKPFA